MKMEAFSVCLLVASIVQVENPEGFEETASWQQNCSAIVWVQQKLQTTTWMALYPHSL